MPLDTRIALGAQPLQIESPLAQYGQAVGIQNAVQQNQLGQMQMSAAQRAMQEEEGAKNFLSGNPDLNTVENQRRLLAFGKTGLGYAKAIAEQKKAGLEGDKLSSEIFGLTQKSFLQANSPIAAATSEKGVEDFIRATYAHPVLGALAKEIKPLDQAIAENIAMYRRDPDQWTAAHLNLDAKSAIDAVTAARERANEAKRIASLPPLPGAVPTGTVDDTRAALAVPGAQPVAEGVQARPVAAAGKLVPVALNTLAPAAASVNALTGNEATLQAVNAERKTLIDRLAVLERMPPSKGREDEIKRHEARLKEISAPINMRADGTTIIPGAGTLTAAAAPSDILRLQREEADLRAAGKTKEADVIADQIKVKNQLRDDRAEMEKLVDAEITARKAGQLRKAEDLADQIKVKNQQRDDRTASQKEQAVLDDPRATEAQKTNARLQLAKLNHIPEKAMSDFERGLAASNLPEAEKSKLRNAWLKSHSEHAPAISVTMPVAVENPDRPGSVIYVDRAEAIGKTPATAIEGLAPKEIQAREAKYPQALQAVKTLETKTEGLAKDIETLANHPGLTGISGLIYGRTPAVTKDARAAQALYDSIVARGGFAELQNMRAASPTGGALGNVSNQEGQYLRDAWAAINRTQDTADLKANLLKAANQARESKARVKEAFDATYDYRANRGVAAPAASSGRGVDRSNPLLRD